MNSKEKIAIENLLVIASYMSDNSVLTDKDSKLLADSMKVAADLIGFNLSSITGGSTDLGDPEDFDVNSIVSAIKNRKK